MRTVIIGDIHGSYRELIKLLVEDGFDKYADRLINLGDMMDRGKDSYGVFGFFREMKSEMGRRE